jgi:hypothetical protein
MVKKLTILLLFIPVFSSFVGCNNKKSIDDGIVAEEEFTADSVYIESGNKIVAATFDTLRSSLFRAISLQGIEDAITFCNEKAYPITNIYADSVAIRRTALRVRNENNKPDSLEVRILDEMTQLVSASKSAGVKIIRHPSNGEVHFFKPIMLQPMCLNCHGTPQTQIQGATLARIQQLYPNDRAVHFKEGDLRGVWHVIFNPKR